MAIGEGLMKKDPCKGIVIRCDSNVLTKDILTKEEIERLLCTRYKQERPDIQRAFVFSLYTGIRFCDIIRLTYANVDFSSRTPVSIRSRARAKRPQCRCNASQR